MKKILLDTHCWLWMTASPERFSTRVRHDIEAADSELYLSAVSAWEIAVKHWLGKLKLPTRPSDYVAHYLRETRATPLPITTDHGAYVAELPSHHRDPFDRLLIAQAILDRLPILTADAQFRKYEVDVIDAS
jgi:PIN domain nuclease of toxin-antitoxin system